MAVCRRTLLFLTLISAAVGHSTSAQHWMCHNITEERVGALLDALNTTYDEDMMAIAKQYSQGDWQGAATALVSYYANNNNGWWWRLSSKPKPSSSTAGGAADNAQHDSYTFYGVKATVPRNNDTGLDWSYRGPQADVEFMYALNRHAVFQSLAQGWAATGNAIYPSLYSSLVCDWVNHVPVPSQPTSEGQWRTLEAGIRSHGSWTQSFYAFQLADNFTTAARLSMLLSAGWHGNFLHKYCDQGNANWRSMQYNGLATVSVAFPEFNNASEWYADSAQGVASDMLSNVYPDGLENEQTSSYHKVATDNFQDFYNVSVHGNKTVPPVIESTLEKMHAYLAFALDQQGYSAMNSDCDLQHNRDYVIESAAIFNRSDWLYVATNGRNGFAPAGPGSFMFPWSGQLIMRNGYAEGDQWGWMDVGPFSSSGHGHHDKLHLAVRAHGEQYLIDSGRFAYSGTVANEFRESYATHTRGHNTLMIDNANQVSTPAVAKSPLVSGRDYVIADNYDWTLANITFDGIDNAMHTRALHYERGLAWVVVDKVDVDRRRNVTALWHAHPNTNVSMGSDNCTDNVIVNGNNGSVTIVPLYDTSSSWSQHQCQVVIGRMQPYPQGWYSPVYDSYGPSPALEYELGVDSSSVMAWVIVPQPASSLKAVTATLDDVTATQATVSLAVGDVKRTIQVPLVPLSS
eukprot:TRINITY_DN9915_c0_g1_i1.p1 TRINITY_DN9915_c0_g1~~TRINITY_DN9915_c0_g1_i1.p1  ORF type:complete len:695 (+),score=139.94 TRINITY_DN9915_c0_g1_i1:28-2085(+)